MRKEKRLLRPAKKLAGLAMTTLFTLSLLLFYPSLGRAQGATGGEPGVVDVGNTICPISGEAVSGKHFFVHEGKRYGACCSQCIKKFQKNPEKYLASLLAEEAHEAHEHTHEHEGDHVH